MYSFSSVVRYSETDADALLSIPALINYLQDCSTFHTESIGHGIAHLAEHHFAWFITAWNIEIVRRPRYTEPIVVRTWCHTMKPTSAGRNFVIETQDGTQLVRADSLWVAFDTVRGRPIRIPDAESVLLSDEPPLGMAPLQRKLSISGAGTPQSPLVVNEQHLDTNHHVNNGQYVAMADRVVLAQDEGFSPRRIQVQYKRPAQLNDTIVPILHHDADAYTVDLADTAGQSFAIVRMA